MTATVACAMAAGCAVLAWPVPPRPQRRLRALEPPAAAQPAGRGTGTRPGVLVAGGLALVVALLSGAPRWLPVAGAAVVVLALRRRRVPPVPELPLVLDLLASCLAAGATWPDALNAAAAAAGDGLAAALGRVRAALGDGAPPEQAWQLAGDRPELAAVARCCRRAVGSGTAAADELTRLAERVRRHRRAAGQERAARASIWVVLPLGLCFLPAFVLVGVVPLALGLLRGVM